MKTKNIFKTLALAMMMPAMLLTTACSSDDDAVNNEINNNGKGYALPVTINVTRGGDATTRATYNESTKQLEFSAGDKLFVMGNGHPSAGKFAGTLAMVSEGIFSGTIYTQFMYTGTFDALFTGAGENAAVLLPNGYEDYQFLKISGEGYSAEVICTNNKAVATTKAAAVEQFSLEMGVYSSGTGFALSPYNAILNFTITGLTANKNVQVYTGNPLIEGTVTTDASGTALFALSVDDGTDLSTLFLSVDGTGITVTSSSQKVEAGHIYNITRSVAPVSLIVNPAVGQVIGNDGKNYADAAAATDAGHPAVAIITYVGSDTYDATFKNGLAIALADEGTMNWSTAKSTCEGKTAITGAKWCLPSQDQWKQMFAANGDNEGSYTGLNTTITTAEGTTLQEGAPYWSSSEGSSVGAYLVVLDGGVAYWFDGADVTYGSQVRACLAF